mgnify:CR=1 FL=1
MIVAMFILSLLACIISTINLVNVIKIMRSERQPEDQDEDLTDKEIQAAMQRTYLRGKKNEDINK